MLLKIRLIFAVLLRSLPSFLSKHSVLSIDVSLEHRLWDQEEHLIIVVGLAVQAQETEYLQEIRENCSGFASLWVRVKSCRWRLRTTNGSICESDARQEAGVTYIWTVADSQSLGGEVLSASKRREKTRVHFRELRNFWEWVWAEVSPQTESEKEKEDKKVSPGNLGGRVLRESESRKTTF